MQRLNCEGDIHDEIDGENHWVYAPFGPSRLTHHISHPSYLSPIISLTHHISTFLPVPRLSFNEVGSVLRVLNRNPSLALFASQVNQVGISLEGVFKYLNMTHWANGAE